ncbi:helix-turn-helix transcriptional regulator [Halobium palmae]|uniref:Helix-turn-helix transcriptional regulator n=1 Tax=Halobium palmae TaxID=1776492 RepID=A0ABD5RX44_9EURY
MTARADIAYLVGSDNRIEILRALRERSFGPSELASACSCARETAHRNLSGFVERGWVERDDGRYRLTPGGEMVVEQYDRLESTVAGADRLSRLLSHAPASFGEIPVRTLSTVRLETATRENPHAPVDRFRSVLGTEEVTRFRGITPMVSPVFNEAASAVLASDTDAELVIDESVLEVSEAQYPDALSEAFDLDGFTLLLASGSLDYGLMLVDGRALVSVHDDAGAVVASVDGDEDEFVDWVSKLYADERERARELDPSVLDSGVGGAT